MRLERPFGIYVGCIVLYFGVRGTIASVRVEARVVSGGASAGCEKGLAWRGDGHGSTQASRSKRVEIRFEVTHRRLPKTLVFSGGRTAMDPSHHTVLGVSGKRDVGIESQHTLHHICHTYQHFVRPLCSLRIFAQLLFNLTLSDREMWVNGEESGG